MKIPDVASLIQVTLAGCGDVIPTVVPARAGTHNQQRWLQEAFACATNNDARRRMDLAVRRNDAVNVSAYRVLPRIRLQSGGFDAGDRADLVIVGSIAADADRAEQDAAVLAQHATGH